MNHNCRSIYLGFGKELDASNVVSLRRHYLPLGKIGGKPAWLNPVKLPSVDQISCKKCKKVMPLLLQIYSSGNIEEAFHRYIYVFMCPNNPCQEVSNSDNFRILRCQLPRENAFFAFDKPINFEDEGEVPDPYFDEATFAKLCNVCGALGTKKCARCGCTWYCSRDHQVIDWNENHKQRCQEGKVIDLPPTEKDDQNFSAIKENSFVFDEFGIELDCEEDNIASDHEDDEDDDDQVEDEKMKQELLKKAEGLMKQYDAKNEMAELNELEESKKDASYIKFSKVLKRYPFQIIRYDRGGKPLLATDHAPPPSTAPSCDNCGHPRQYEFQLMPYLLSLIRIDDRSSRTDFASVFIYTCSNNCQIANNGYIEEIAFKQDFVDEEAAANLPCEVDDDE